MSGGARRVGARLRALRMRSPQPYLRMPRMYFDAFAAPRQPRAQMLRDETEHAPSQQGGRALQNYEADNEADYEGLSRNSTYEYRNEARDPGGVTSTSLGVVTVR